MNRPRVGYDIDGVLCDFKSGIIEEAQYYDSLYEFPNSPNEWDSYKPDGFNKVFKNCRKSASFWLRLEPLMGAYFHQVFMRRYAACYITARPMTTAPDMYSITSEWLLMRDFPKKPLIVDGDKVKYTSTYALDYFIEDKYENWVAINEAFLAGDTKCQCLLLNTPHNLTFQDPLPFSDLRFESLKGIEAHILGNHND